MRVMIAAILAVVGALLTAPGSLAVWQDRVFLDEDTFVATVDEAFEQEDVQIAIAERLTVEIMEQAEIRDRIGNGLAQLEEEEGFPAVVGLLEIPLTVAVRDVVFRTTLRLVEAQPLEGVREVALRGAHRVLTAIVNADSKELALLGDRVVLDLRDILRAIVTEIGGEDGEGFLGSIDLSDDAGQIVLTEKSSITTFWTIADWAGQIAPWVVGAAIATLVLAVVISPARRETIVIIGVMLVIVGAITIVIVAEPLQEVAVDAIAKTNTGHAAAEATYDIFARSFQRQEAFIILFGVALAAGGSLAGDPRIAAAVRSRFGRPVPAADTGQVAWVRERVHALRVGGLGISALLLIAWPDPSTRLVLTLLALTATYLAVLTAASSDAQWAVSIRSQSARFWDRHMRAYTEPDEGRPARFSLVRWLARRASWFRIFGIVIAAALLIALPSVTLGTFVLIVALELLYLAAVDMIVNRASG